MSLPIEQRFAMLVGMVEKDMTSMKQAINALQMEIAGAKAEIQQLKGIKVPPATTPADEVVGTHPVTGQPVTRAQIEADPKLKLRMTFADNGA